MDFQLSHDHNAHQVLCFIPTIVMEATSDIHHQLDGANVYVLMMFQKFSFTLYPLYIWIAHMSLGWQQACITQYIF